VLGLRAAMAHKHQSPVTAAPDLSAFIADDVIWSCTTCGACNAACPVGIEVFDKIVEIRRGSVKMGEVPQAVEQVFDHTTAAFNPSGKPAEDRMAWAGELDVPVAKEDEPIELLYLVGCAGSFDPDGQGVSRSMIKILKHLGIKYRMLGKRERCTGGPARRMGEEGLFQKLDRENIPKLGTHGVQKVLTQCPHCFNTFKNEYPQLGARFEVEHHSAFLARMVEEGRLKLSRSVDQTITFHDPCYLGRANGQTDAPRVVLNVLPSSRSVEMERSGENSFCCGAGGGSMWLDVKGADRVENIRVQEAAATGATTIAIGCPFCKSMLKAGSQSLEGNGRAPQVKGLAELIVEAEDL
jgi:Fe-S oxidoreductase